MKESQRLLKDSRYRIREVSEMVGYTNEKTLPARSICSVK